MQSLPVHEEVYSMYPLGSLGVCHFRDLEAETDRPRKLMPGYKLRSDRAKSGFRALLLGMLQLCCVITICVSLKH